MTSLALLALLFGGPVACPPEVGQIRWDGFDYSFNAGGKKFQVSGTLWDRDRNGKPSSGDLYRITNADMRPGALAVDDELWVVVRGSLAQGMKRRFRKTKDSLRAQCESRFDVKDVPKMGSPNALGRYLRKVGDTGPAPTREDRARSDMSSWAQQICAGKAHITPKQLEKRLFDRAVRGKHGAIGRGHLKRVARDVAKANGVECGHLAIPDRLTFD